ncbi:MAG: hypothetical protein IJK60_05140 [Clostridia bacterium]|nr:hypothetical protein [Clostridia bacterium]
MSQCPRCGYSYDGDLRVCPKCKAALVSSDYKTALDSLSGYYDSASSTFVHNESVVIFKGETKKEAVRRVTKGKILTAFFCGVLIFALFCVLFTQSLGKFLALGKVPDAVAYTADSSEGTYVAFEANTLIPIAESYYEPDIGEKTVYCFASGADKTYALVAMNYDRLNGKYRNIQFGTDEYDKTKTAKIKGTVTKTGSKELSEIQSAMTQAKMNFNPVKYINVDSGASKVLTGTILLLLALFVLGTGLVVLSFGFRKVRRQAKNVKNAFRRENF